MGSAVVTIAISYDMIEAVVTNTISCDMIVAVVRRAISSVTLGQLLWRELFCMA